MLDDSHFEELVLLQAELSLADWIATLRKHAPTSPWLEAFETSHREIAACLFGPPAERKASAEPIPPGARDPRLVEWRSLPLHERQRLVLEALADERRTRAEIAERALGNRAYQVLLDGVLRQLMAAGDVRRAEIPGYRGGPYPRWRYVRNAELRGPIAELERTFNDQPEAST